MDLEIQSKANLTLVMLRHAVRIEPALTRKGRIEGLPRELHRRVMEPMVPVLFFATLISAVVGGAFLLLADVAHVPAIAVSGLSYPVIFSPAAIFLFLNLYFWYSRLTAGEKKIRIDLSPGDALLQHITWLSVIVCAAAGLVMGAVVGVGVPF